MQKACSFSTKDGKFNMWGDIMKIGCHISVSKGFYPAAQRAVELGASSFQIFTKNPRGLRPKKLDMEDAKQGAQYCETHDLAVVAHTPYITNLSTADPELWEKTVSSIREDLEIASAYGAVGAVVHCGKHVGNGEEYGTKRMVETLDTILEEYNGSTLLLLENTAGQGTELGQSVEKLMEIRHQTKYPEKIGFCFDTCHAFAAGIWNHESYHELVHTMDETDYLDHLVAIHFNDSKAPYGSRKDRHEKIGQGEIGADALRLFLEDEHFQHLPVVLETPVANELEYADEIQYLHQLKGGV